MVKTGPNIAKTYRDEDCEWPKEVQWKGLRPERGSTHSKTMLLTLTVVVFRIFFSDNVSCLVYPRSRSGELCHTFDVGKNQPLPLSNGTYH